VSSILTQAVTPSVALQCRECGPSTGQDRHVEPGTVSRILDPGAGVEYDPLPSSATAEPARPPANLPGRGEAGAAPSGQMKRGPPCSPTVAFGAASRVVSSGDRESAGPRASDRRRPGTQEVAERLGHGEAETPPVVGVSGTVSLPRWAPLLETARHDRRASPSACNGDQFRQVGRRSQPKFPQFEQCLVDPDDADAATGRIHDHVGQVASRVARPSPRSPSFPSCPRDGRASLQTSTRPG